MNKLKTIINPINQNLLISFADITNFTKYARQKTSQEIFDFINELAELTGSIIEKNGGMVVKFLGDAAIIIFSEDQVSKGTCTLMNLKESIDKWLKNQGLNSTLVIKAHFGEVTCGPLGTISNKQFDIMGENVNITALVKSNGFAITPQVFRKLDSTTRKLFKKHTPPITYIDVKESHKN